MRVVWEIATIDAGRSRRFLLEEFAMRLLALSGRSLSRRSP
jgi:hypothetical protein